MKFAFTGRKMEVSDALRAYTEKKLSKLDRFFSSDAEAQVTFHTERGRDTAEVTVRCANMFFRAQETANDMYGAIDSIVDMIERQIRKNKTRLARRLRQDAFVRSAEVTSFVPDDEEHNFEIVRFKEFPMKPMTREEAILQMNLLEHNFFAFKDEENDQAFAVVYKRNDGGYGLIENID